jgi:hypothetical protein
MKLEVPLERRIKTYSRKILSYMLQLHVEHIIVPATFQNPRAYWIKNTENNI